MTNPNSVSATLRPAEYSLARSIGCCLHPCPRIHHASVVALALALATPVALEAAAFTVINLNDAGPGSLRQAVADANANSGSDTIEFINTVGTIALTSGEITITDSLVVNGPGADRLTIDGNLLAPIFRVDIKDADVTLAGLTLTRGEAGSDLGGAVTFEMSNTFQLKILNSVVTGNTKFGVGGRITDTAYDELGASGHLIVENSRILNNAGGGVSFESFYNIGTPKLAVRNSVISGNLGPAFYGYSFHDDPLFGSGGELYATGLIEIRDSRIFDNQDYAAFGECVALSIHDSELTGNKYGIFSGRGTWNRCDLVSWGPNTIEVENSRIVENGSGVRGGAFGYPRVFNSLIADNGGTGVFLASSSTRYGVQVEKSTITGNTGAGIGGTSGTWYSLGPKVTVIDSTISGNADGGIKMSVPTASLSITNSAIANNNNGGINLRTYWPYGDSSVEINNSTISGNQGDTGGVVVDSTNSDFSVPAHLRIRNSTITENAAASEAGGITFKYHPYFAGVATAIVNGTLVAGNSTGGAPADMFGTFSADFNLIGEPGPAALNESVPGSNLIGLDPMLGPFQDNGGPTFTHQLLPGNPAIDRGDPVFIPPPDFDQRGEGYPRVVNGRVDIGAFEVQEGAVAAGRAWLRSVGDLNGDGTPEIAVVSRVDGKNVATVKDAASGALLSRFVFGADLRPVDVQALDIFGSGDGAAPSLVLLSEGPPRTERRDLLSGNWLGRVSFNPKFSPVALATLPDQDGSGSPELGMLGQGSIKVELRDAVRGNLINNLWFDASFEPRQVITLPDLNGNASAEVGVLLGRIAAVDRLVVKDSLTGEHLQTLTGGQKDAALNLLQVEVVEDRNGDGIPEVAMLFNKPASGATLVRVMDAATNVRLGSVGGYSTSFIPSKLAVVADITGNGIEEYAVLGRNPLNDQVTAEVRDGRTSKLVARIWFGKGCTPLDLVSIADINANGAEELVMLGRCGTAGQLKAFVRDARSGALLRVMDF